jgi:DNA-nicking Smr family endonuclease
MPKSFQDEIEGAEVSFVTAKDIKRKKERLIREPGLAIGDFSRADGGIREEIRRGKFAPERTLDLHGRTLPSAYKSFINFITASRAADARRLLVITGRGSPAKGTGAIKEGFAAWINDPKVQSLILAVHPAGRSHGGSGAFYILLRKG